MIADSVLMVVRDAATWTGWALACGWWHRRTPPDRLSGDGLLLRLRSFEEHGRWYEDRLHIKRWKDRLPETGGRQGGMSKRQLPGRGWSSLSRFSAECVRGERTHWSIIAGGPAFALWSPLDWSMLLTTLGVVANAPFIAVLRYNRSRIHGITVARPHLGPA
jgi:glycosyl-4,4'-diaponeurosporenoate acyltransferase